MTNSEIISQIKNHFRNTIGKVPTLPWDRMLVGYQSQRKAGKSSSYVSAYWSSKEVGMKEEDAALFADAMAKIEAGQTIPDVKGGSSSFPWVKATAIGAVALFVVWGLPNLVKATRDSGHKKVGV